MEHLNYCRQLTKHCTEMLEKPNLLPELRAVFRNAVDLNGMSQKFLLPDGGRVFVDPHYKALDESKPLRLPYKYIALEYRAAEPSPDQSQPYFVLNGKEEQREDYSMVSAPKRVVFAREHDDFIVITVAFWAEQGWRILPECALPSVGFLDRAAKTPDGSALIKVYMTQNTIPRRDYADEVGALLCFLNVLQCSNVHVERSEPKNWGKKIKSAFPFDAYHVLTIDAPNGKSGEGGAAGGHRSPREHLRRGHIRRLEDGRRIWVNATVVAAGRGAGVVSKDYAVRA